MYIFFLNIRLITKEHSLLSNLQLQHPFLIFGIKTITTFEICDTSNSQISLVVDS